MKKFITKIKNLFFKVEDEDVVYDYLEKKEKGHDLSEEERQKVLNSAIKLTKDQKEKLNEE